jgi:hypothetical protein
MKSIYLNIFIDVKQNIIKKLKISIQCIGNKIKLIDIIKKN